MHRDHDGWAGHHYTDTVGRNDITICQGRLRCQKYLLLCPHPGQADPYTDPNWMQLLIDADLEPQDRLERL